MFENDLLEKECLYCKIKFSKPRTYKKGNFKFCSRTCANRWNTEHKKTGFYKGHPGYDNIDFWKGKKLSEKHKQNISDGLKNSPTLKKSMIEFGLTHRGVNHWNWKGGKSGEEKILRSKPEYHNWRLSVYKRDHYSCKKCGLHCKCNDIIAHHIKPWKDYPELRYNVDNGITLCRSCHKKIHEEIGFNTRFTKLAKYDNKQGIFCKTSKSSCLAG